MFKRCRAWPRGRQSDLARRPAAAADRQPRWRCQALFRPRANISWFAYVQWLGNRLQIREEIYRMNTIGWLDTLWQDVRFGARLLRRTPGFTAIAVLSLTLGIGANTAIFQVMDAVRLRALPVSHPEQLVEVRIAPPRSRNGNFFSRYAELSNPQWEQIRARQEAFSGVLAWAPQSLGLSASGEVRRAEGLAVSGNFFEVLGVPAARGRVFTDGGRPPWMRGHRGGDQPRVLAAGVRGGSGGRSAGRSSSIATCSTSSA